MAAGTSEHRCGDVCVARFVCYSTIHGRIRYRVTRLAARFTYRSCATVVAVVTEATGPERGRVRCTAMSRLYAVGASHSATATLADAGEDAGEATAVARSDEKDGEAAGVSCGANGFCRAAATVPRRLSRRPAARAKCASFGQQSHPLLCLATPRGALFFDHVGWQQASGRTLSRKERRTHVATVRCWCWCWTGEGWRCNCYRCSCYR
eukprot:SAG11_NODE_1083_length_5951_cov_7.969925_2_plen_208_part_00